MVNPFPESVFGYPDSRKAAKTCRAYAKSFGFRGSVGLELFRWDQELMHSVHGASSFLLADVSNVCVQVLTRVYGSEWETNESFLISLPDKESKRGMVQGRDLREVDQSIQWLTQSPELWIELFSARHVRRLWKTHAPAVFPNLDECFPDIQSACSAFRLGLAELAPCVESAVYLGARVPSFDAFSSSRLAAERIECFASFYSAWIKCRPGQVQQWCSAFYRLQETLDMKPDWFSWERLEQRMRHLEAPVLS